MTLIIFGFMFVIGLIAVNASLMFAARASAQRAADAAVLAGCQELPDVVPAENMARTYGGFVGALNATAATNLESGTGDQTATPTIDSSGAVSEQTGQVLQNNRIRVLIERTQNLIGLPSSGFVDQSIVARATCIRDEGGLPVLHALGSGPRTLRIDGSDLDLPRGGIIVNSTDPNGFDALGNATVVANYIETGSGTAGTTGSSSIEPPPALGTLPDPYADVPQPAIPNPPGGVNAPQNMSGCTYPNPGETTARQPRTCVVTGGTISPGVYYGGIRFEGNATMEPGIYHMVSGGFEVDPGVTVTGDGVMIFNDGNPYGQNNPLQQCGAVLVEEGARLLISPYGGEYEEVMIFQRRTPDPRTGSSNPDCSVDLWIQGGVTIGYADGPYGAIYTPNSRSLFGPQGHGSSTLVAELNIIVVADRIDLTGPILFADIFIPSGTVRHGDIHLVE
jgi:hypothetical protein